MRALAVDRQSPAVAQTLVAADLHLAADVGLDLTAEVTLGRVVLVDPLADLDEVFLGEVAHAGVGVDTSALQDLLGTRAPDAEDVGEGDLHALLTREVNA